MSRYKKILLAVDFHEDNGVVIEQAKELAELYGAELHAVHVSENISFAYAGESVSWSDQAVALESLIRKENEKSMQELRGELGIAEDHCHLLEGRPASRIHDLCEDVGIDLIVMGTHGQHGLQLLLGSTANAVLHGTKCDVHAVRLPS